MWFGIACFDVDGDVDIDIRQKSGNKRVLCSIWLRSMVEACSGWVKVKIISPDAKTAAPLILLELVSSDTLILDMIS